MKITVTQEHIKNGEQASGNGCPLALAIRARMPFAPPFIVGLGRMRWIGKGAGFYSVIAELPQEARDFYWRFDQGLPVQPFTFEI